MVALRWIYNGFAQLQMNSYKRGEKMSSKLLQLVVCIVLHWQFVITETLGVPLRVTHKEC